MTRTFRDWQERARRGGIVPKMPLDEIKFPDCDSCDWYEPSTGRKVCTTCEYKPRGEAE